MMTTMKLILREMMTRRKSRTYKTRKRAATNSKTIP